MGIAKLDALFDPRRLDRRWEVRSKSKSPDVIQTDTATEILSELRGEARELLGVRAEVMEGFIARLGVTLSVWEQDQDPSHIQEALVQLAEIEDLLEAWLLWQRQ